MELKNNTQSKEDILNLIEELGFMYYWNDLEELYDNLNEEQIIIEGDEATLFLEIKNDEIISVDYLPFPKKITYYSQGTLWNRD